MRLLDVVVLYCTAGAACGVLLYRRARTKDRAALLNAVTAGLLWPLVAPILWNTTQEKPARVVDPSGRLAKIRAALDEAAAGVRGTPFERLFGDQLVETIWDEAQRLAARNDELRTLLRRREFELDEAERRLEALEKDGVSARAVASARLHVENVRRLTGLLESDARALVELEALVNALRTELLMVRLSGSSSGAVDDIVGDLWAQIEGLRQATEQGRAPPARSASQPEGSTA